MKWGPGMQRWLWRYYGKKAANLRANGNPAAADALIRRYEIPADRIPTIEAKGHRRGNGPRIRAAEPTPPVKREAINRANARRRDRDES